MENKDIIEGNIGTVGKYDLKFEENKLILEVDASVSPVTAGVVLKLDAVQFMDKLAAAIPGKIDDAIIGIIKAAVVGS